jgi:hypothetical protein
VTARELLEKGLVRGRYADKSAAALLKSFERGQDVFGTGYYNWEDAERNPEILEAIADDIHYQVVMTYNLDDDSEPEVVQKLKDLIERRCKHLVWWRKVQRHENRMVTNKLPIPFE